MTEVDLEQLAREARAKFQIPTAYQAPNTCLGCGKTDNGNTEGKSPGMASFGIDIDWYGVPHICSECAFEIASLFGAISPQEYRSMEREANILLEENFTLRNQNSAMKKVIDGYRELDVALDNPVRDTSVEDAYDHPVADPNPGTPEPTKITETSTPDPADDGSGVSEDGRPEQGHGDSEADEPIDIEGPADILDTSGSDLGRILAAERALHSDGH